jgi:hypothetical protein
MRAGRGCGERCYRPRGLICFSSPSSWSRASSHGVESTWPELAAVMRRRISSAQAASTEAGFPRLRHGASARRSRSSGSSLSADSRISFGASLPRFGAAGPSRLAKRAGHGRPPQKGPHHRAICASGARGDGHERERSGSQICRRHPYRQSQLWVPHRIAPDFPSRIRRAKPVAPVNDRTPGRHALIALSDAMSVTDASQGRRRLRKYAQTPAPGALG